MCLCSLSFLRARSVEQQTLTLTHSRSCCALSHTRAQSSSRWGGRLSQSMEVDSRANGRDVPTTSPAAEGERVRVRPPPAFMGVDVVVRRCHAMPLHASTPPSLSPTLCLSCVAAHALLTSRVAGIRFTTITIESRHGVESESGCVKLCWRGRTCGCSAYVVVAPIIDA
jgi:hypothetical protein